MKKEKKLFSKFKKIQQFRHIVKEYNNSYNREYDPDTKQVTIDRNKPKETLRFYGTPKNHGCFDKDTYITMSSGEYIKIKDVKAGDNILTYNVNDKKYENKTVKRNIVQDLDKDWIELTFFCDEIELSQLKNNNQKLQENCNKDTVRFDFRKGEIKIKCTKDHKFYTKNRGWVHAQHLNKYDDFIIPEYNKK